MDFVMNVEGEMGEMMEAHHLSAPAAPFCLV